MSSQRHAPARARVYLLAVCLLACLAVPSAAIAQTLTIAKANRVTLGFAKRNLDAGDKVTRISCRRVMPRDVLCTFDVSLAVGRVCTGSRYLVSLTKSESLQGHYLRGTRCTDTTTSTGDTGSAGSGTTPPDLTVGDVPVPTANQVHQVMRNPCQTLGIDCPPGYTPPIDIRHGTGASVEVLR